MQFNRENLSQKLIKEFMDEIEEEKREEEEAIGEQSPKLLKFFIIIIFCSVLGFSVYALVTDKIVISRGDAEIPIIQAFSGELREKPEDPGGMYIANRDKEVYDAIGKNSEDDLPKVVRLLPQPEEPIKREQIENMSKPKDLASDQDPQDDGAIPVDMQKEDKTQAPVNIAADMPVATQENTQPANPEKSQEVQSEKSNESQKQEEKPDDVPHKNIPNADVIKSANAKPSPVLKPEGQKLIVKEELASKNLVVPSKQADMTVKDIKVVPASKKTTTAKEESAPEKKDGYRIQLGSFRSEGDVNSNWSRLKNKYSSLIGSMKMHIEKANVTGKGTFYRLQVGSFDKESDARKICNDLTSQGQGCFVAKK